MNALETLPLLMLPGLACDQRLFAAQREHFSNLIVPAWPTALSVASDAQAVAKLCWDTWTGSDTVVLSPDQPYLLGGHSSGGIIALEMAWLGMQLGKPPAGVLLISSCRSWQAVPRWYGRWSDWSAQLPQWLAARLLKRHQVTKSLRSESAGEHTGQLVEAMYQSSQWDQLRMFARLMASWRREEADWQKLSFPIHQLHGRRDALLPKPSPQQATLLLDAGHWMCATHAESVNNWLEAICRDTQLKLSAPQTVVKLKR